MNWKKRQMERNRECEERHALVLSRLKEIVTEESVAQQYVPYFQELSLFLLELENVRVKVESGQWDEYDLPQLQSLNRILYSEILGERYETCYGNPDYASRMLGKELGPYLCLLYAEMRSGIPFCFEGKLDCLTILYELFVEVYHSFEECRREEREPSSKELQSILYWYASDYCDVFLDDRIQEQIDPEQSFAADLIQNAELEDDRYLYRFGEYISENELGTARYLRTLPEETIQRMADVYTEGYRIGFLNTGKDLSKKSTVCIRYPLGFERVIRLAIENFRKMGLRPVICRWTSSVIVKRDHHRVGYTGGYANRQYDYDHRQDQALLMDRRYIERKLEVFRTAYENRRSLALQHAGPAVLETFGEIPFSPVSKDMAPSYNEAQRELATSFDSRFGQLVNQYIPGDERSFTIVAYPVPEIGPAYPEIFNEVIRINTLDASLYEKVQQTLIDALDQGEYVRIKGANGNRTDLKVQLFHLSDPEKQTIFENCVADVNIPVGEVFTTPVLEGTQGTLHVSRVYLEGLEYRDLELTFADGKITGYRCGNFETEEEGRKYLFDNVLKSHETLPMGEFAIGTNTTAYVVARKYGIEAKMPILIAEKTGPHFAVGDTCYSWSEEIRVYNPNGKEIVAKDNSVSIKRKEDVSRAYLNCHTDITLPYDELEEIIVVTKDGKNIILIENGMFALPGTEVLNEPFKEEKRCQK